MKEKFFLLYIGGLSLFFIFFISWFGYLGVEVVLPNSALAATNTAVTVIASVETTISCEVSTTSVDFEILSSAAISIPAPISSTTMACANSGAGCALYVVDIGTTTGGGLYNATSSKLIASPDADFSVTSTLVIGFEGYGLQATTIAADGSGALLSTGIKYAATGDANDVGGLNTSDEIFASSSASTTGREVIFDFLAAVSDSTPGGVYEDSITFSCLAN